ncbi:MAG: acetate uptake transporter [Deferribacteraceae bacterium]|jgi:succinate-acetate transporter protein|nr:acetate uptake transporter [Deferribacteraceae bacterium]
MKTEQTTVKIVPADPSGLGIFGLALVTLVASSQKLGFTEGHSFIIPWALFLGGVAQLIACFNDYKLQNIFGATAFGAYGLFWIAVSFTWMFKIGVFGPELAATADIKQLGMVFMAYLIFSLYMTVAAMETNKALFIIIAVIDVLFLGLMLDAFGFPYWGKIAAVSELIISLTGFYAACGVTLNAHFGKKIIPLGKPFGIFK